MGVLTRTTEPDDDPDSWAAPRDVDPDARPDGYTDEVGEAAVAEFASGLERLRDAVTALDSAVDHAGRWLGERLDVDSLVETYAVLVSHREAVQRFEAVIAREAGQVTREVYHLRRGTLPDGRPYEVRRKQERAQWDHDRWQADVRAAIVERAGLAAVVDSNGEMLDASEFLTRILFDVETVHGATGPRLTALRALDLDPDDYCQKTRGAWTIDVATRAPARP